MKDILVNVKDKFYKDYPNFSDESKCHIWTKYKDNAGYGQFQFRLNKKYNILAHRASYMYYNEILLDSNDIILHTCDNPSCVNPLHLMKGTHKDNVIDRVDKNRSAKGTSNGRVKLTEAQARLIKASNISNIALSRQYGVDRKAIYDIKKGITWKHI